MSTVTIKQEMPNHPDAIALIQELNAVLEPLYPPENRFGFSVEKLMAENVPFFVLREDDQPAACGGVKLFGAAYGEVKRMYVRPEFRGKGYAKQILAHLEHYLAEHHIPIIRLETGTLQHEAIGLYEAYGFRRVGAFGEYVATEMNIFYEKEVTG